MYKKKQLKYDIIKYYIKITLHKMFEEKRKFNQK